MKKGILIVIALFLILGANCQILKPSWLKWEKKYTFDKYNVLRVENYSKKGELMMIADYKTYYQSNGNDYTTIMSSPASKDTWEVLTDKKNECFVECYWTGGTEIKDISACGYTIPADTSIKQLVVTETEATKDICGYKCRKYDFTFKKTVGEIWVTDEVKLSNDIGIFRASHMDDVHNTISVDGFIMEITMGIPKGQKTIMKTISLINDGSYTLDCSNVKMGYSVNKKGYFDYTIYPFGF